MCASNPLKTIRLMSVALACCQLATPIRAEPAGTSSGHAVPTENASTGGASTNEQNTPAVGAGSPASTNETDSIVVPKPVPAVRPVPDTASEEHSGDTKEDATEGTQNSSPSPPAKTQSTKQSDVSKKAGSFSIPNGRWTGTGKLVPTSGVTEDFKCVVTYIPARGEENKPDLTQNLRCKSRHYRLDATAEFIINDRELDGFWQDRANNVSGHVQGVITEKGYEILLKSETFEAYMQVTGTDCRQSVTVVPMKITYVRELTASLRKC